MENTQTPRNDRVPYRGVTKLARGPKRSAAQAAPTLRSSVGIPTENRVRASDDFVQPPRPYLQLRLRVDPVDVHLNVIRIHMDAGDDVEQVANPRMKREVLLEAFVPGIRRPDERSRPALARAASTRCTVATIALGAPTALRRVPACRRALARRRPLRA
jgi:hypothetical protein